MRIHTHTHTHHHVCAGACIYETLTKEMLWDVCICSNFCGLHGNTRHRSEICTECILKVYHRGLIEIPIHT